MSLITLDRIGQAVRRGNRLIDSSGNFWSVVGPSPSAGKAVVQSLKTGQKLMTSTRVFMLAPAGWRAKEDLATAHGRKKWYEHVTGRA